jgi:hypothetical protein
MGISKTLDVISQITTGPTWRSTLPSTLKFVGHARKEKFNIKRDLKITITLCTEPNLRVHIDLFEPLPANKKEKNVNIYC